MDRGELGRAVAKEERLKDLMRRAGMDVDDLFRAMDVDASGAVSWDEYAAFVNRLLQTLALEPSAEASGSAQSPEPSGAEEADEPVSGSDAAETESEAAGTEGEGEEAVAAAGIAEGGSEHRGQRSSGAVEAGAEDAKRGGTAPGSAEGGPRRRGRGAPAVPGRDEAAALPERAWEWGVDQLSLWLRACVGLGDAAEVARRKGLDGITLLDIGPEEAPAWLEVEDGAAARKLQAHLGEHEAAHEAHLAHQRAERAREEEIAQLDRAREQEEAEARAALAKQEHEQFVGGPVRHWRDTWH